MLIIKNEKQNKKFIKCNFEIEENLLKRFKENRENKGYSQKDLINLILELGLRITD